MRIAPSRRPSRAPITKGARPKRREKTNKTCRRPPMAELAALDGLWLALLRKPLSWWARPHVLPEDLKRRYGQHERPICYVIDLLGVADLVVLEQVCAAQGLPEPLQPLRRPLPPRSVLFLER